MTAPPEDFDWKRFNPEYENTWTEQLRARAAEVKGALESGNVEPLYDYLCEGLPFSVSMQAKLLDLIDGSAGFEIVAKPSSTKRRGRPRRDPDRDLELGRWIEKQIVEHGHGSYDSVITEWAKRLGMGTTRLKSAHSAYLAQWIGSYSDGVVTVPARTMAGWSAMDATPPKSD